MQCIPALEPERKYYRLVIEIKLGNFQSYKIHWVDVG